MKAVIIANKEGIPLVSVVKDRIIDEDLTSAFICALSIFGEENLGKIEEIMVKGLDIDLFIVYKHELILIAIMDTLMKKKNIKNEAEMALNAFYNQYKSQIESWDGNDVAFSEFERIIETQIENYYSKIDEKGFFERMKEFFSKS